MDSVSPSDGDPTGLRLALIRCPHLTTVRLSSSVRTTQTILVHLVPRFSQKDKQIE